MIALHVCSQLQLSFTALSMAFSSICKAEKNQLKCICKLRNCFSFGCSL